MHHVDVLDMVLSLRRVAQVLDEVHDVRPVVHIVLRFVSVLNHQGIARAHLFQLLNDAAMEIHVVIAVPKRIVRRFLRRCDGRIQML